MAQSALGRSIGPRSVEVSREDFNRLSASGAEFNRPRGVKASNVMSLRYGDGKSTRVYIID